MRQDTYHFDIKTLISGAIVILSVFISFGLTSKSDMDEKAQQNYKLDAVQEQRINTIEKNQTALFDKINAIETSTSETHDNMIILMVHSGLEPILIENNKKKH